MASQRPMHSHDVELVTGIPASCHHQATTAAAEVITTMKLADFGVYLIANSNAQAAMMLGRHDGDEVSKTTASRARTKILAALDAEGTPYRVDRTRAPRPAGVR